MLCGERCALVVVDIVDGDGGVAGWCELDCTQPGLWPYSLQPATSTTYADNIQDWGLRCTVIFMVLLQSPRFTGLAAVFTLIIINWKFYPARTRTIDLIVDCCQHYCSLCFKSQVSNCNISISTQEVKLIHPVIPSFSSISLTLRWILSFLKSLWLCV